MRKYEMTYLISDLVREGDLNKVTGQVAKYIADLGGKTIKEDIWGRRKLAYPIRKQDFATYVTLYFSLDALKMKEFDRSVRLTDGIVRQLVIVTETKGTALTLTATEIAGLGDIEDVVGGDKSFEAVEGMTDESKKLMSVREEDETAPTLRSESRHEIVRKDSKDLMAKREVSEPAEQLPSEIAVEDAKEIKPKKTTKTEEVTEVEATEDITETTETVEQLNDLPAEEVGKTAEQELKEKPKKAATKKAKTAPTTEEKKVSDEVERLSKLNEELDDILKDEL